MVLLCLVILTSPRAAGTIEEVWKATFLEQDVNDAVA
jgi:hypothetical protein